VYYYHFDGLGSVAALSDVNNVIVERYSYDVFGEPNRESSLNNPYLFTGRRYDIETGLYYYRARYYKTDIGRFLQADPIGYAGGLNLYAYCGNNPVNWIDPFGLFFFGIRPLDEGQLWWYGTGPLSDFFNLEGIHEHGFFEDGTGDNIGFGPNGRYSEDPRGKNYKCGRKHYDDDLMREALRNVKDGEYNFFRNNCQHWASRLRKEYRKLKRKKSVGSHGGGWSGVGPPGQW